MEAAEEVGDAEVGEKDEKEGDDAADVKDALGVLADAQPFLYLRVMEKGGVNQHRDQRPRLFRVPTPITSPRHVRPNDSDENAGIEPNALADD